MELVFIALLSAYAVAVSVFAASLYGQQRMMNKMAVEAKRREHRETRKSENYLEALMRRTGIDIFRRTPEPPDSPPRPSRNIVPPSQIIQRQREEDANVPKQTIEQVPPAIRSRFLQDAANANGAAEKS
jgi:hypothetical protein